jgi:maltooligosyltrehalose trehalohydrolase
VLPDSRIGPISDSVRLFMLLQKLGAQAARRRVANTDTGTPWMKRKHSMPFSAEILDDRSVRFRLWAPKPARVDVLLGNSSIAMKKDEAGWFSLITDQATAGSTYQFVIDGGLRVPDPASRFQPHDVHGPCEVIDPASFEWTDDNWNGRPWEEAVIYELHTGAFSKVGSFAGIEAKLDYLVRLNVTAIELMPVSDFFGKRNWGYDGVLPYAPDSTYGRPEDLKRLVQSAHAKGLMVFLDVVYNHFGPEGNYLGLYAPQFFTSRHKTPWGDAINFDGGSSRTVRDFFIHNALYWLEEFHLDGLRLDAVHAIQDDSSPDILTELGEAVQRAFGAARNIHLILENEDNEARYLRRNKDDATRFYDGQWNDDIHHVCHVISSGERDTYYVDYQEPIRLLGRALTEGFAYQGEPSSFRGGKNRGEASTGLPLTRFISFLQNHDQIGNRAFGDRDLWYSNPDAIRALAAILWLAPSPPLLFMGEEFAADSPFLFFCDFEKDLAKAVTDGRRQEFAKTAQFSDEKLRNSIPDPNDEQTFLKSKLNWESVTTPTHARWLEFYSSLLAMRQKEIVPLLRESQGLLPGHASIFNEHGLAICWRAQHKGLELRANLGSSPIRWTPPKSRLIYSTFEIAEQTEMPAWSVAWYLSPEI